MSSTEDDLFALLASIFIVIVIIVIVTGNLLPIIVGAAVAWALYHVASGIAGGKR